YLSTYLSLYMFFFIDPSTSEIYTLSLHDALPILVAVAQSVRALDCGSRGCGFNSRQPPSPSSKVRPVSTCVTGAWRRRGVAPPLDRKSTRLNSSHVSISYAVFCLKKKNKTRENHT